MRDSITTTSEYWNKTENNVHHLKINHPREPF